jgi:hypothetical protein
VLPTKVVPSAAPTTSTRTKPVTRDTVFHAEMVAADRSTPGSGRSADAAASLT